MDYYIKKNDVVSMLMKEAKSHDLSFSAEAYERAANLTACMPNEDVQPAPQWISVEERLPNHYEEVLVVSKLKNIVYFAWYDADISMFMGHGHMWTTREVTHWMPLPEPPKE